MIRFLNLIFSVVISSFCYAQVTHPCPEHPEIRDNFKLTNQAHSYIVEDLICENEPGTYMTPERVFTIMLQNTKYVAPFPVEGPVEDCGSVLLSGEWHIVTKIDYVNNSVTNYTMPDHILFEGKVIRKIVQRGNKIYMLTIGSGNNKDAVIRYANNSHITMEALWKRIDLFIKEEVTKRMVPIKGHWNWIDWRQASPDVLAKLKSYKEWDGKSAYDNIVKMLNGGCSVQVAELDLDGDGDPGIAVKEMGNACCNFKKECPLNVYEAKGYKRTYLIDNKQYLVKPANNGILSSAGVFFDFQDFTQLMNSK